MTEREFSRCMAGLIMPSHMHRMILAQVCIGNDAIDTGDMFALAFGAVCRVPLDRVGKVTLRQLQEEYQMPAQAYLCAIPKGHEIRQ